MLNIVRRLIIERDETDDQWCADHGADTPAIVPPSWYRQSVCWVFSDQNTLSTSGHPMTPPRPAESIPYSHCRWNNHWLPWQQILLTERQQPLPLWQQNELQLRWSIIVLSVKLLSERRNLWPWPALGLSDQQTLPCLHALIGGTFLS